MCRAIPSAIRRPLSEISPTRFIRDLGRRLAAPAALRFLAGAANIVLVLALADMTAKLVWLGTKPLTDRGGGVSAVRPAAATTNARSGDYRGLTTFDPFHRALDASAETQASPAPETTLDLKLFGIRAGTGADAGSAIIRTPDRRQDVFRVGETVMEGVRLAAVKSDRVIIAHDGSRESLFIDDAAAKRAMAAPEPDPPPPAGIDPAAIIRAVEFEPRFTGAEPAGLVLKPGADDALFRKLGLAAGDVLVAVNGTALDGPEKVAAIKNEIRTARTLRLKVVRDGANKTITLSTEE